MKAIGDVTCMVCGSKLFGITPLHLATHGLTVALYRTKYPKAPLFGPSRNRKLSLHNWSRTPGASETLSRILKEKAHRKVTPDIEKAMVETYMGTKSAKLTSEKFGIHRVTVERHLARLGIKRFPPPPPPGGGNPKGRRLYTINHNAFSDASPEALYWAGFLAADGNIKNPGIIRITLAARDRHHLEKFLSFIGSNSPIRNHMGKIGDREYPQVRIEVYSQRIVHDLARSGIVEGKADCIPCNGLESSKDFFRGLIDGDGCLTFWTQRRTHTIPRPSFAGRKKMVEAFLRWGRSIAPWLAAQPRPTENIFQVSLTARLAHALVKEMYEGSSAYLDRKMGIAKKIIAHYKEDAKPTHQSLSARRPPILRVLQA